jgi:hypothetical protein
VCILFFNMINEIDFDLCAQSALTRIGEFKGLCIAGRTDTGELHALLSDGSVEQLLTILYCIFTASFLLFFAKRSTRFRECVQCGFSAPKQSEWRSRKLIS